MKKMPVGAAGDKECGRWWGRAHDGPLGPSAMTGIPFTQRLKCI